MESNQMENVHKLTESWAEDPTASIINLPKGAKRFKTDLYDYFVVPEIDGIPIERYIVFEKKTVELALGGGWDYITATLQKAMGSCNGTQAGSNMTFTILFNLLYGMTDLQAQNLLKLQICTLFIFREGEDPKGYNSVLGLEKIQDWKDAGFSIGFFLDFVDHILKGFKERSEQISQALQEFPPNPETEKNRRESLSNP